MIDDFTLSHEADDQRLLGQIVDYYHRTLKSSHEALDYLRQRGITNGQTIDQFRIGYCDRTLGQHVPDKKDEHGRDIRERLERLGLLHGRGHELFINFVVFPIRAVDESGRIVDIYGRRIFKNFHRGILRDKHLNDATPGVWNVEAFAATEEIILCPSLFDALTFWNHGYRNATCTFSPDTLTEDLLVALKDFRIKRVMTPCERLIPKLQEAGLDCFRLPYPPGSDANAYALQAENPAEALGAMIRSAAAVGKETAAASTSASAAETTGAVPTAATKPTKPKDAEGASGKREARALLDPTADDQQLLAQVVDYYHRTLKGSQEALDFLRKRGITNGQAIDQFRIGYANRTLGLKLPTKNTQAGRALRGRLEQIGLFRAASGHEHFNGSVVFPITAADGTRRIVDLYGHKIRNDLRTGTPLHTYLSPERQGVWNIEAFAATEEIILCPSLLDALTFWSHGYRNVTCTFGPDALTDDHMAAFQEFKIRRVLIAHAGLGPRLLEAGLDCYCLKLPSGVDVNAYALQVNDPASRLGEIIRKAEWLGKGQAVPPTTMPVAAAAKEIGMAEPAPVEAAAMESFPDASAEDEDLDDEDDADLFDDDEDEPDALEENGEEEELPDAQARPPEDTPPAPTPVLAASPLPPTPQDAEADVHGDEVVMTFGNRRYRVRGLAKNLSFDVLRVNLLASNDRGMFVDTFDLYAARHRKAFITQAAQELGVEENTVKKDVGRVLLKLEELQDEQIKTMLEPKQATPVMTDEEKDAALRFLRDPKLLDRILADFQVVGETTNKLVGYLAAVSRKLDQPLAIIIQSSSAAGKTALMEAVLSFVPPEDQVKYSAMTGQSLFYVGETDLQHKILAIVEEEGAERASYALKLLQSEGELMIASTGKDASSGRLITQEYRVQGPVMIFLTTTAIKIDEELLNRCIVLTVDEDREQTKAIHRLQRHRQTLQGLLSAQDQQKALALHHNAQRLLRPLLVANPFAEMLTFLDDKTRTRRDHVKYLTLIRAVTLLHQYQRPVRTTEHYDKRVEYIEVTLEDIEMANRLANEVLGRSVDDLPPQTRRLLGLIDEMVTAACQHQKLDRPDHRFSRRDIREFTGWGHTQLKVHLKRLEELEYLLVHRGGRGQSFVYELLFETPALEGQRFLARLIDVDKLRRHLSGSNGDKSGTGRPQGGAKSGRSRPTKSDGNAGKSGLKPPSSPEASPNGHLDGEEPSAS